VRGQCRVLAHRVGPLRRTDLVAIEVIADIGEALLPVGATLMTQSGHRRHVRTAAIPVAEVTDQENQGPREVALENAASALQNARGLKGRSKD
jgi:predicted HD phosphohydrolase